MILPYFKNIRKQIIKALKDATKEILVAVYWFSNEELFLLLCKKLKEGVAISLIVHYDSINNGRSSLNFQEFVNLGGRFYFSPPEIPMHNKFCVIDEINLINGSYNWTYYADVKNSENVLIITEEPEVIHAFRNEFHSMVRQLELVTKIPAMVFREVEDSNSLSLREYMAQDLVYKAKALNKPELVKEAMQLARNKLLVQRSTVQLGLTRKKKLINSIGVKLHGNKYMILIKKNTVLPVTGRSSFTTTIKDNQLTCQSVFYYGEDPVASSNTEVGRFNLTGIPPKPLGEAKMKYIFSIDLNGKLTITKYSIDNGRSVSIELSIDKLIKEA